MGLRGVETGDGVATLEMVKSPRLCNAFGVIYGGAIAYLAYADGDACAASSSFTASRARIPVCVARRFNGQTARRCASGSTRQLMSCYWIRATGQAFRSAFTKMGST